MRFHCLLLAAALYAQPGRFGLPACSGPDLELAARRGFVLCYDLAQKLPRWTAHQLPPSSATSAPRRRPHFRPDSLLSRPTAANRDFTHSPFARGHLVPAADLASDATAYADSFLLSNVLPQDPQVNASIWRRVENATRRLSRHAGVVIVIAGTLTLETAGRIGPGQVAVPSHTFKVILTISGRHREMYAVLVPNHPAAASLALAHVATTVDELEQVTGLDFFSALEDSEERLLESTRSLLPSAAR